MTVYVDDMYAEYRPPHQPGRTYVMCHLISDDENELHRMARMLGLKRSYFDKDHYDVTKSKRAEAVKLGAVEITWRQAGIMMTNKRRGDPMGTPETCFDIAKRRRELGSRSYRRL